MRNSQNRIRLLRKTFCNTEGGSAQYKERFAEPFYIKEKIFPKQSILNLSTSGGNVSYKL